MVWNKWTSEKFYEELEKRNSHYKNGEFTIIGDFTNTTNKILVNTKYGMCNIAINSLLNNTKPTLRSAINKQEFSLNQLREVNDGFRNNNFTIIKEFLKNKHITYHTQDEFGICEVSKDNLMKNKTPTIESATDKNLYAIKRFEKIYDTELYDYKDIEYINSYTPLKIFCNKHRDYFYKSFSHHIDGQGCIRCAEELKHSFEWKSWHIAGINYRYFSAFKLYILKLVEEDGLVFYKIGKTFKKISQRCLAFKNEYKTYEILHEEKSKDGVFISELEQYLKTIIKDKSYIPKKKFGGYSECFTRINITKIKKIIEEFKTI